MADTLALAWRPRTFTDLVGQPAAQILLQQMIKVGKIPTALLFDGCRGTGKTTTARILAAALNCTAPDRPCGTCPACTAIHNGTSLDLIEIDAASNGLVDDIRKLREQVRYATTGGYRVVALDEAHNIGQAGFNALLKMLEEPPPRTLFILLTTEPGKILPTVASRCIPYNFRRLTIDDIVRRLYRICQVEQFDVEVDLLQLIAERADGAMRDAIMLLEQVATVGMRTADQYRRLIGYHDHAPDILDRLLDGDLPGALTNLDTALTRVADPLTLITAMANCLRDVLVLRCGGDITKTGTALAARQNLALALESPTVLAALRVLWQLTTGIKLDDRRAAVELGVVMLADIFNTLAIKPARITLADMTKPT